MAQWRRASGEFYSHTSGRKLDGDQIGFSTGGEVGVA
jgi:hypothetical protein